MTAEDGEFKRWEPRFVDEPVETLVFAAFPRVDGGGMNRAQAAAIVTAKGEKLLRRSFEEWLLLVDRNEECSVVSDDGVVYTVSAEAWQESREPRKIELVVAVTDGSLRSGFAPVVWRQEVNGVRGS